MANPNPLQENIESHRFEKGQSGNPHGRPKGSRNVSTILKEMLEQVAPGEVINAKFVREFCRKKKRVTKADAVAARIFKAAIIDGESWAVKELNDRTEGKATQTLEIGGPEGGPIEINIVGK